jgi:hypothetical protein
MDAEVAQSEAETGYHNASLANFMRAFGNITNPVGCVLETYFSQCALRMNCVQLPLAGLSLANAGVDPIGWQRVVDAQAVRRINAIMMTCGHYDASGDFAFRVGLPGKSGVGGGILGIAPRGGRLSRCGRQASTSRATRSWERWRSRAWRGAPAGPFSERPMAPVPRAARTSPTTRPVAGPFPLP